MTEEQKKQIAAFRFGVICELVNGARLNPGEQARADSGQMRPQVADPVLGEDPHQPGNHLALGAAAIAHRQRAAGVPIPAGSQRPGQKPRCSMRRPRSALIQLRQEMPRATIAHLIEQMQRRGILSPPTTLSLSTVYRLLHEHHLMHPAVVRLAESSRPSASTTCGRAM